MATSYISRARKVVCIGRNYADHIKELNNRAPSQPIFFIKPTTAILTQGNGPILRPRGTTLHYELEMALVLGKKLQNLDPTKFGVQEALDAIDGYALALDLTARNVQEEAKKKGMPWTVAKGFDTFLPISGLIPKSAIPDPHNAYLKFFVNGLVKQSDSTSLMIFKINQLLSSVSSVMTLEPGDIVLTGTPKGVGAIVPGDKVEGELSVNGKVVPEGRIEFEVADRPGPYEYRET